MSGKKYFECAICGKKYEACYSCGRKDPSLSWKNLCDTAEHYKIFQIVNGYTAGVYTKEEASKKLKNVNLSDLNSLRDNIKAIIKDIQNEDDAKPVRRSRKKKTQGKENVVDQSVAAVTEDTATGVAEETVVEEAVVEPVVDKPVTLESATTII